ncbi:MAG TPA: hypothetical protein VGL93_19485 [Streptosporangiaceae bacterium]|jgi:hypothetical protein
MTRKVPQAAQAWIGDVAIVFAERRGDVAVLAVHGREVAYHVVEAELGRTVDAGPFAVTATAFGFEHGRDVVVLTVTEPAPEGRPC